jgi:prepilin-type N-terminal cleavage/methylation domain-containing protein
MTPGRSAMPHENSRKAVFPGAIGGRFPGMAGHFAHPLRGFSLIELMAVVLIGALVMAIAIPNLLAKAKRDPLNQAIVDLMDAFREARGRAILSGSPMQVVIVAGDGTIRVEPAPPRGQVRMLNVLERKLEEQKVERGQAPSSIFSARIDPEVAFKSLVVNTRNRMTDPAVGIQFNPNGTCDQFEAIVSWPKRGSRKVSLEVTTSLPEVEDAP